MMMNQWPLQVKPAGGGQRTGSLTKVKSRLNTLWPDSYHIKIRLCNVKIVVVEDLNIE